MDEPEMLAAQPAEVSGRIALLADVHGNAWALEAVLADIAREDVDAVCFLGCLTWGPRPSEVLELARSIRVPTFFIRGNGERAVLELAAGARPETSPLDSWMVEQHGPAGLAALGDFALSLQLAPQTPRAARLCHGSPRSDIELLTPATTADRVELACVGVEEDTVVHGHTHLQYQRQVGRRTIAGCGSVGLPYTDDGPAAYWTELDAAGPHGRRTPYDVEAAADEIWRSGYPAAQRYVETMRTPPRPADIVLDAESKLFSD